MARRLISSVASYMVISMLERGVNFLLTFVLTYYLIPEEMGKVNLFVTMLAFVFPLVNLYTSGANLLAWHSHREHYASYYSSTLLINVGSFVVISLLVAIATFFTDFNSGIERNLLLLLPLIAFCDSVRAGFTAYAQAHQRLLLFGAVNITATVANLGLTFLLLHAFQPNHEARLWAMVGGGMVTTILVIILARSSVLFARPSKLFVRDALRYGVPLIPHAFGIIVMDISDRFFINHYTSKSDLGHYGVAYTLASLLGLMSSVISMAWTPHFNGLMAQNTPESRLKIARFSVLFIAVFTVGTLLFALLSPVLFGTLVNIRYLNAQKYLPWLALVYAIQAIYYVFAGVLFFHRKTIYFMWVSLTNIGSNLLLNWWLVPRMGALGAAVATAISMTLFTTLIAWKSAKLTPLPWRAALASVWHRRP